MFNIDIISAMLANLLQLHKVLYYNIFINLFLTTISYWKVYTQMKKQIIKTNIGYFEKKKLSNIGKEDAQRGIVYTNNGTINSPFIEAELSLCIVKVQNEYENYLKYKHNYQEFLVNKQFEKSKILLDIKSTNERIERAQSFLNNLKNHYCLEPDLPKEYTKRLLGEDSFDELESQIQEFRRIENSAPIEVEKAKYKKRREELLDFIETAHLNILSLNKQLEEFVFWEEEQKNKLNTEYEIYITRCKQHYSYSIARIYEYWKGVLQIKKETNYLNFADNNVIYESLLNNLNTIADKLKEENYGQAESTN